MCATFPSSIPGSEGRVSWRSITSEPTQSGYRRHLALENALHKVKGASELRPESGWMRPVPRFARKVRESEPTCVRCQPTKGRIAAGVNERSVRLKVDSEALFVPRQARSSRWWRTRISRHLPDRVVRGSAVLPAELDLHVDIAIAVAAEVVASRRRCRHHRSEITGDTRRHGDAVHGREWRMRNNARTT